ncbi:hypothetical protein M409DRAFT_59287 [Zasmidium cellare ATCC 36951]|uniref:AAA+ ATPase domain-containing protein n=1 Tax=Zasmidium cellare ATCC 36951 TaxID=1080233 RepID=A0A6A6C526_ZASCE|nr:uncharacterized protein M409DRAFT_59287 [Zasmidium cellare ATCC 36951]KAF2161290.1 hypothetical protein M409DRAFT_59287 [Zasmidium cellare ATCC 36951]
MKVGLGLKLQEAWKRNFETRPSLLAPAINAATETKTLDEDVSDEGEGPFKQLAKEPQQPKDTALHVNTSLGYRDECITVDARPNNKGEYVLVKGSEAFDPRQDPKKARKPSSLLDPYCLVVTRRYNVAGMLEGIVLEIQSQEVIRIIREIVTYYPDNSFRMGDTIKCEDPPKLIYYYRHELASYAARLGNDRAATHIGFVLNFLQSHIGHEIENYEAFLAMGLVSFKHMWMIFKPGSLVYHRETDQLYFLEKGTYTETECGPVYALECHYVDYDGNKVGKVKRTLVIKAFSNQRELDMIPTIPLDKHLEPEALKERLKTRAKRFLALRGIHALHHSKKGRVMVDAKTFLRRALPGDEDLPNSHKRGIVVYEDSKCCCKVCLKETDEKPEDYDHELREITHDEMLLCSSSVLGFALGSHKWIQMQIDDLTEIHWSTDAIDRLVLDKRQKRVLSSLISSPVFTEGVDGDVIGWKGKGLVMLLHGAPGTGKTLTAESVCESLKRPLYIVSGGELGVTPQQVEKSLEEILELSKLWKAVILIDEADVFLEARSAHDIVRNNFVSVFLRRLEYFEGILMLTTNRVEEFDEAFISRIHLALNYPELEPWMRKEIWVNALKRFPADQLAIDTAADLEEISKVPLNGRIISYAVRTAKAIADEDKTKLAVNHLWDVVSVQQKFNDHLRSKRNTAV